MEVPDDEEYQHRFQANALQTRPNVVVVGHSSANCLGAAAGLPQNRSASSNASSCARVLAGDGVARRRRRTRSRRARRRCRRSGRAAALLLQARLVAAHHVEGRAGELARVRARRSAGAWPGRRTRRRSRDSGPRRGQRREPLRVERARLRGGLRLVGQAGVFGSSMSPATCRCWSTASRAISRCMISVEPSKMRLMRMSRSICSAGTGFSPRRPSATRRSRSRGRRGSGPSRRRRVQPSSEA